MDIRPIPALYCCYLLRSKPPKPPQSPRPPSWYIGSTPNPRRRLAQHNGGTSKGGAVRTSRIGLDSWEMACIVTGFPSNIAALQFEWAWQNTHLTRRIADEQRITKPVTPKKGSPKTGRTRRRPVRPKMSLENRLKNLHLLLRVPSFARWPLEVRFFREDVYRSWQKWTENMQNGIRGTISAILDLEQAINHSAEPVTQISSQVEGKQQPEISRKGGIGDIDASYMPLKSHLERSLVLLAEGETNQCAVCAEVIQPSTKTALVCPIEGCRTPSHVTCLSKMFLQEEEHGNHVVPLTGKCPRCKSSLQWIDLVREMSLRTRGAREIAQLMKKPRQRKTKSTMSKKSAPKVVDVATVGNENEASSDFDIEDCDDVYHITIIDEPQLDEACAHTKHDDDDATSVTSVDSVVSHFSRHGSPTRLTKPAPRLGTVIEDTDWDSAEVLD